LSWLGSFPSFLKDAQQDEGSSAGEKPVLPAELTEESSRRAETLTPTSSGSY
jgi:hypothetical protein